MKAQRVSAFLALLVIATVILAACQPQPATTAQPTNAPQPTAAETTLDRAKREGIIRVGFANEAPFAYAKPDGTLAGEAPDIAAVVFQRLGIAKMEGILTEFGSLIPGLQANRFDVITAGMYIKPERCEQVLFADPEYKIGSGLLIKAGNPLNLHSYEDIAANPDAKVGTGAGYFEADYLAAVGVKEDQIVLYPDNASGLAGVQAGQIDAFTATSLAVQTLFNNANDSALEVAAPFTDPVVNGKSVAGYSGTAFRKGEEALRDAFTTELNKLETSGELLQILITNGFGEANLPGETSWQQACAP